MKRAAKYGLIALLAALIVAGGVGAAWLAGTTEGFRWLMDAVSRHTPLSISAQQVEGRLFGRLSLGGVRVALAPMEVEVESLDYRWEPLLLLVGKVAVKELTLTDVQIRDSTPGETAPDLTWPRASGIAWFFDGGIEHLQVNGLTYRLLDSPPVSVTSIASSVTWRKALLSLSALAATSPAGRIEGNVAAGFDRPFLHIDLAAIPAKPVAGMDAFTLQGRFLPAQGPEQLAGSFTAAGASDKVKSLELAGEAGVTRQAFHLRQVRLTGPGRRGSITGEGTVTLTAGAPMLALQLSAAGLDLAPELKAPTDISGTVTLTGTPEIYQGEFKILNQGKGWQAVHLSGAYQGDGGGVKLTSLTGSLLAGSLQGNLDLRWNKEVSLKGTLRGRNLDPAGITPDWAGVVNFDLAGGIAWSGQAPPPGEVTVRLLESRLHGKTLAGDLRVDFAGGDLRIGHLALMGKGFDIHALGDLGKRVSFTANVGDLGLLIPETTGQFRAEGWVRWLNGRLAGAVTGQGGNLATGGIRIASANLTARLGEGKGYPVYATATLRALTYDRLQADSVTLEADGTALRHTVRAALHSAGAKARIALSGTYDRGSWRGQIVDVSGRDKIGPWKLEAPAALTVTATSVTLGPLVLTGVPSERLEAAGEITREPLGGDLRVAWGGLNLARANQWLPREVRLDGRLTGRAEGKILAGEELAIEGRISLDRGKILWKKEREAVDTDIPTADLSWRWQGVMRASAADIGAGRLVVAGRTVVSGSVTTGGRQITMERGSLSLEGDDRGLHAAMEFVLAGGGTAKAAFSSSAPARLAVPETGDVTAEWTGVDLALLPPWLSGELSLGGILGGRVTGKLIPKKQLDLSGKISLARGKIHWQHERSAVDADLPTVDLSWNWQGALPASAADISAGRLVVAGGTAVSGSMTMDGRRITVDRGSLSLEGDDRSLRAGVEFGLAGGGTLKGRFSSLRTGALAVPAEGEAVLQWDGIDLALLKPWLPGEVRLDGRLAGRIAGKFLPEKQLDLSGKISLAGGKILWQKESGAIDAALTTADLSWNWQGALPASAADIGAGRLVVAGRTAVSGSITTDGRRITVERGSLSLDGDGRGLRAGMEFSLTGGGMAKGAFSSPAPARLAVPQTGDVTAEWSGDLALLRPWLPRGADVEGRLTGRVTGRLLPGQTFALKGDTALSGGKSKWLGPEGEINLNLRSASVSWDWQGEALRGSGALELAEQGQAQGSFRLPIAARLPVSIDRKGPLEASLNGQVLENGLLSFLFPGLMRESRGELVADLRVGGTWEDPKIEGSLKLAKAGAYLPTAGIHVKDIQLVLHLEKDLLRIDSFRAVSGPGQIEGTALVQLKGWQVTGYRGSINGERFQFVYFPEIQVLGSPRLTFEGTPKKLAVRGEVRLPELLISGPPTRAVVLPSRDVILEGAPKPVKKAFPLALDVQVRVALGDKVLVKMQGIDVQLDGAVDLVFQRLDQITSKGEIRVVKGRYKAYGVDLEIVRGRLSYTGGSISQPALDILALRTIGDVRAGITAAGPLRTPVIKLYSEPVMPQIDILGYIIYGYPLGNNTTTEQAGMMAQAAGMLLAGGEASALQDQIKNKLGLSTLGLETVNTDAAGRAGYKELPTTPSGGTTGKQSTATPETLMTVGTYLTPQIYLSYGKSLTTGNNLFRIRYDIVKQWQIETQTGSESSADIYYKIDFN